MYQYWWETALNSLIFVSKLYTRDLDQVVHKWAASHKMFKYNDSQLVWRDCRVCWEIKMYKVEMNTNKQLPFKIQLKKPPY